MKPASAMTVEAYAKVNLVLEVAAKRVDGYHALRSLVVPVSLADTLEIRSVPNRRRGSGAPGTGPVPNCGRGSGAPEPPSFAKDLALRAAAALRARCGAQAFADIRTEKRIPVGGGLGGGSADAAATLVALNGIWGAGLGPQELCDIGAEVGSDVPALVLSRFCGAVLMEGRGEKVSPAPFANVPLNLVLANPGVFSSTAEVFAKCVPHVAKRDEILYNMRTALESGELGRIAAALVNDLEKPASALHPEIAAAKSALAGAGTVGAAMSGSGSTVFGLVPTEARGREIAASLVAKGLSAWSVKTVCPVV